MSKPDWAERKVNAVWKRHGGLLSGDDMVAMLIAERARAVMVCKKQAEEYRKCSRSILITDDAQRANRERAKICDDCAAAIDGRKP